MNFWLSLTLFILCLSFLLEVVVSTLNIKALSSSIPDEFVDVINPEEYLLSHKYTKATTFFSLTESTYSLILTLFFIAIGGFSFIDLLARRYSGNEILSGLIFTGACLFLSFIAKLPFSIYFTFVIEAQFGFNKTTAKLFCLDILKSGILLMIIGGPLLALIFWLLHIIGPNGWLLCWIGVVIFSLLIQYLAPVIILPLFNKFTQLPEGTLRKAILEYARQQGFIIQDIFTMDGSKRSGKLNAFFIGFGQFKKIVFFDTLLATLRQEEILAVLAHEMGHYKLHHVPKMLFASILHTGIMFYLLSLLLENSNVAMAFDVQPSVYASLMLFVFLYLPVNLFVSIVFHAISRKHEFEADQYAVETIGSAETLIDGLKKLSKANLSNLTPHPIRVVVHYSHPPVLLRIQRLRQLDPSL